MASKFYDANTSSWVGICTAWLVWLEQFEFPMAVSHPADNGGSSWTKAACTSADMQRQGSMFPNLPVKEKKTARKCTVNAIVVPFPRWQLGAKIPTKSCRYTASQPLGSFAVWPHKFPLRHCRCRLMKHRALLPYFDRRFKHAECDRGVLSRTSLLMHPALGELSAPSPLRGNELTPRLRLPPADQPVSPNVRH
ncbi:hypothetical protein GGI35DRAFT_258033 [Trichoderma velutinum]